MTGSLIELDRQGGVAVIRLNRPDKRNAINDELRAQLVEALEHVARDQTARALVLTANGAAFCAGGDVSAMRQRLETDPGDVAYNGWLRQQATHHAQILLHTLPIPTIAAVNGAAAGLGADLALACDFIVASKAASFAWAYVNRGLISDGGGMYFLPRRVGLVKAKELIFSGRTLSAEEALGLGVADRLSDGETLLADALKWASELTNGSRVSLALSKTILNASFEHSIHDIFSQGSQAQAMCYTSTEHRRSVEAFLQKSSKG